MTKDLELTQEQWDRLLDWLDPDRDQAAARYTLIQLRLIRFFASRGCVDAEYFADKTINIVACKKVKDLADYVGDKSLYFHGVGKNVYRQEIKHPPDESLTDSTIQPPAPPEPEPELIETFLDECMENLDPDDKTLVVRYQEGEKQEKIRLRQVLAREIGITLNALRIKMYRLHLRLEKCIKQRLRETPAQ
jgi:hypothetical protein